MDLVCDVMDVVCVRWRTVTRMSLLCLCISMTLTAPPGGQFSSEEQEKLQMKADTFLGECGFQVYGLGIVRGGDTFYHSE